MKNMSYLVQGRNRAGFIDQSLDHVKSTDFGTYRDPIPGIRLTPSLNQADG